MPEIPTDQFWVKLLQAFAEAPIGFCYLDTNLRFTFINDHLAEINGVPAEEHLGRTISEVIPDVSAGVEAQLRYVLETGISIVGGTVDVKSSAHPEYNKTFQHNYYALKSGAGRVLGIGCIVEEVTERKRAEEALRASEERYAAILQNATDGIVTINDQGTVQSFNPAAEQIFGYTAEEVIGRNVMLLVPEPDRSKHDSYIGQYLETNKATIIGIGRDVSGQRKDGSIVKLHLGIGEVRQGNHLFFIGTLHDLTERNRYEEQLRRAQRLNALGQLAGGIAHDFNNLLLPIITITEVTKDDLPPDGPLSANLDKVLTAAKRATNLVEQILTFSQRKPVALRPIDIRKVVDEALALISTTMSSVIEIRVHFEEELDKVLADGTQIHEIILNLVSNAAHAIGRNPGVIEISLRQTDNLESDDPRRIKLSPGTYVKLRVSDTGCGMDEETAAKIFDPFFTTKPPDAGSGMGLSAVYGIVTGHGGAIAVSSRLGLGATFDIYFPTMDTALDGEDDAFPRLQSA